MAELQKRPESMSRRFAAFDFASRLLSRMRQLFRLLRHRPDYLLGRFTSVRRTYSKMNALKDSVVGAGPLRIGDLYHDAISILEVEPSGHVLAVASSSRQVEELRTLSYSVGPHLGANAVLQLRDAAQSLPLRLKGPIPVVETTYMELSASRDLRERTAMAIVSNSSMIPVVRALAGDRHLFDVARQFLGYQPKQVSTWLFWSIANDLPDAERRAVYQTIDFHYDVDGFNFMYASFYILETGARNGAHVLMEGTGTNKRLRHLLGTARLSDREIHEVYGRHRERVLAGPAGFGFMEDASCYHKALPPLSSDRLMLQLRYQ